MQVKGLNSKDLKTFLNSLGNIIPNQRIYEYKGKFYTTFLETKMKAEAWNNVWTDVVVYLCLYHNEDGMFWVRPKDEFYKLFKLIDEK